MSGKPWEIVVGDVRRVLRELASESFDACLSDPPYGIRFMGRRWDYSVPSANVWVELLRVLRPGAYAMIFGGTKTFHRLMVNVEDAGLFPLDTCMWCHGKGWPKSLDISKAVDAKLGATRTRVIGYKQSGLDMVTSGTGKTVTFGRGKAQGERTGKGRAANGLIPITAPASPLGKRWDGYGTALKPCLEPIMLACKPLDGTYAENVLAHGVGGLALGACLLGSGALPPNLMLTHDADCSPRECAPDCPVRMLAEQSKGTSSRIFYVTKATREERDRGLDEHNDHPTVKPPELVRYFARLMLPPPRIDRKPRRIVVPYCGSGSEMIGCLQAGWDEVVGIELDPKHAEKARKRITRGQIIAHAG